MPIRPLSPLLVNQIAAGEVIERPASVVRELVDNALDAGATRIDIRLEDGGRRLVRVADNGCGIEPDQLPLALAPHATSKIATTEDLQAITTLGFRGEALASMASVAQVRLVSRRPDRPDGAVIEAAGQTLGPVRPIGCAPGTVVEVRNLFFNTPARRKFLRGAPTEFGYVNDVIARIAMARPQVTFAVHHNDRPCLDLPATAQPRRRCIDLLGNDLADALLEFERQEDTASVWGLAGLPQIARSSARYQYFYVNGRPVRDRLLAHAVKEAYRGLIEPSRYPLLVLFLSVDPHQVDVNVHPAKAEVRFAQANHVHGLVLAAIRARLLQSDLTVNLPLAPPVCPTLSPGRGTDRTGGPDEPAGSAPNDPTLPDRAMSDGPGQAVTDSQAVQRFVEYFKRIDPRQKTLVYQQVRQALADEPDLPAVPDPSDHAQARDGTLTGPIQPCTRQILQVHDSYIVTQDDNGILIIDQHALHERVMFAQLMQRIRSHGRLESQRLLTPAVLEVSPAQLDAARHLEPMLDRLGIEVQPMGPNSLAVHAFATLLFDRQVDPVEFVTELLDRALEQQIDPSDEAALHRVLDMMSCKAAVKAGQTMSQEELAALLDQLDSIERSSSCPHGRPTSIRLSLGELEKHFKRT